MGRIKTNFIKRAVHKLVDEHRDSFSDEFGSNKTAISQHAEVPSKKMRNVMAGYITRLLKKPKP